MVVFSNCCLNIW